MKILIVMSGFFPGKKYGGPPVSVDNFCTLMDGFDCYIVCRDHDMGENVQYSNIQRGWNKRSNCEVWYLDDHHYNEAGFEKIIQKLKPDIMYLQGLFQFCVFPCLRLAKKYHIKVLLAPRGELCAGAFRKKYKKIPYIIVLRWIGLMKNVHFQSTSDEETEAIKKWLGISGERIHLLTNIPSIPKEEYLHPQKKPGCARLIFLSRIIWKKNLLFALQCLREVTGNVTFDIYGPIEDKEYWEKCQLEIKTLPDNIKVNYCGLVGHDEVHRTFARYDAFLFPTLSENFGHVIAEALSVGCPVIISDQTPFTDVEEYGAGWAIRLNGIDSFSDRIQRIVEFDDSEMESCVKKTLFYFSERLKLEELREKYTVELSSVLRSIDKC